MKLFIAHLKLQLKNTFRNPAFWIPTVLFPMMFYVFFGSSMSPEGIYSKYAIASFCVYAVVGVAFYQFGAGIAQAREEEFSTWVKTLPKSAIASALSQAFSAMILAIGAVLLVIAASHIFGKSQLSFEATIAVIAVCLIISIPAALMGIALGYSTSAKAASALANLIFLPLAFLGGLWLPPIALPEIIKSISIWTPTRQMGEFAWAAVTLDLPNINYILGLGAYTIGFAILVIFLIRRDGKKRFG